MTECCTPGSMTAKELLQGTPASARGSSMFSPGEAFWSEAIQFADNLCVPSNHAAQNSEKAVSGGKHGMNTLVNSENGNSNVKPEKFLEGDDQTEHTKLVASFGSVAKHAKDLTKKSSLPVKHFDFEDATNYHQVDNHDDTRDKGMDCSSVMKSHQGKIHISEGVTEVQNVNTTHALIKRDLASNQDVDNHMSSLPNERAKHILGSSSRSHEASTSSSFLPLEDRLDLISWLPPEICSIYKKKGISKLYPWQVKISTACYWGQEWQCSSSIGHLFFTDGHKFSGQVASIKLLFYCFAVGLRFYERN